MKLDTGRWELKEEAKNKPVSLTEFKNYRNLSITDTTFDTEYQMFLDTATRLIEKYLNYNILNTSWYYYLKSFDNLIQDEFIVSQQTSNYFTIYGKGNIQSITSLKYLKNNVWTTILSTDYKFEKQAIINSEFDILSIDEFPDDYDLFNNNMQIECVKVELIIGFGENAENIPQEIRLSILQLASKLYDSKGICEYDINLMQCIFDKISSYRAVKQIY